MSSYASVLAARSRLTLADVLHIIETAPLRYKVYPIAKKSGGERLIAHPARELKLVQRSLVNLFAGTLPVHSAATAYEMGSSIFKNARVHSGRKWLIKLDIQNFFNSICPEDWCKILENYSVDEQLYVISKQVFFWKPRQANQTCLSVGAPSSPFVINRLMYNFDASIQQYCEDHDIKFTRYADDIALSANEEMDFAQIAARVENELKKVGGFLLNQNKCRQLGPGSRKQVTGLILANDGRVTLGRKRRRVIEARLCNFLAQQGGDADIVRGHLAFLKLADHAAYNRLKARFGDHVLAGSNNLFS